MKKGDRAMIVYSSPVKAGVKACVIKMTDSSSFPKKKTVVQNEMTIAVEKKKKLPLFCEPKIKARKFDFF